MTHDTKTLSTRTQPEIFASMAQYQGTWDQQPNWDPGVSLAHNTVNQPEIFVCYGNMIQSHVVHFKCTTELSQLQVNVTHIHFQPVCIVKHPVSCDNLVSVESFGVHLIVGVLVRQIEEHLQGRTQFITYFLPTNKLHYIILGCISGDSFKLEMEFPSGQRQKNQ